MHHVNRRTFLCGKVPISFWAALVAFASVLFFTNRASAQVGVLDQVSPAPFDSSATAFSADGQTWQQQIRVGVAGTLEGITLNLTGTVGGTMNVRIRAGAAPSAQPVLFQALITNTNTDPHDLFVNMQSAAIVLAVGDVIVLELQGATPSVAARGTYVVAPSPPFYPEPLYNGASSWGNSRIGFKSYMIVDCPVGSPCNDLNACTKDDTCASNGICTGTPVICEAVDDCHGPGTCNGVTGICSTPELADGTGCNDGDGCTQDDICKAGFCVGQSATVCFALDACHAPGTCNATTGKCDNPNAQDGTACDDTSLCSKKDICIAGVCTGTEPVVCAPVDGCHEPGACIPSTGLCTSPQKPDGSACSDNQPCYSTYSCQAGVCVGGTPIACAALDQCHNAGTCEPGTGLCTNPNKANGSPCNDSNLCTATDTCQAGVCTGSQPVVCPTPDQCHLLGVCDPLTGTCTNPPRPDGDSCEDGEPCTINDTCQSGSCVAGTAIICTALDECHFAGVCKPATGTCTNPIKPDGTICSKGICLSGVCRPPPDGGAPDVDIEAGDGAAGAAGTGGTGTGGGGGEAGTGTGGTAEGGSAGQAGEGGSAQGGAAGKGGSGTGGKGGSGGKGGGGGSSGTAGKAGSGASAGTGGKTNLDAGTDANVSGATPKSEDDGGCGCRVAGSSSRYSALVLAGLALVLAAKRRRRS